MSFNHSILFISLFLHKLEIHKEMTKITNNVKCRERKKTQNGLPCEVLIEDFQVPCEPSCISHTQQSYNVLFPGLHYGLNTDWSPAGAPDLCQRKMITGTTLALSHVHDCLEEAAGMV